MLYVRVGILGRDPILKRQENPVSNEPTVGERYKNGGPFDPPLVMRYRLVMKVHVPLARQRPKGPGYQPRGQACSEGRA
jgi:hypothetical protein